VRPAGPDRRLASGRSVASGRGPRIAAVAAAGLLAVALFARTGWLGSSPAGAAAAIAFGVSVGAYGTMVGAGGGFLLVPALLVVYHARPEQAAGTSLAVVFLNALSGSISYARQRRIDYRAGGWFALATLPGAVAGAFFARLLSGRVFDVVFAALLLAVSALLLWRPAAEEARAGGIGPVTGPSRWHRVERLADAGGAIFQYRYHLPTGIAVSFFVGFLSSVLGIGGGIVHVPAMVHLLGFPPHVATATSHFILAISAGAGAASHLALRHVLVGPAALLGIGVVAGAQLGARLARRLRGAVVVRLLSLPLVLVAIRLLLR